MGLRRRRCRPVGLSQCGCYAVRCGITIGLVMTVIMDVYPTLGQISKIEPIVSQKVGQPLLF